MKYGVKELTIDEKDLIDEFLTSEAYKVLVTKVIPGQLDRLLEKIVTLNVDNASDMHKLLLAKAHHEGAMMLLRNLEALKRPTKSSR